MTGGSGGSQGMAQLSKRFTDEQVKDMLNGHLKREIPGHRIAIWVRYRSCVRYSTSLRNL